MYTLYWYPKCSTCQKAKKWLESHDVSFETYDMIQTPPKPEVIAGWMAKSQWPIRRFFNTSGMKYRELGLKDQIESFTVEKASQVLATDGMLIKRPLLVKENQVVAIGFKEIDYEGATS
ncbi:arsenate reductase [Enterococcus sp. AZ194]|uniref:arsenate reductase family protein n=1 Tax=Enterococcus sp. AZ194 TaxID=2774629 RepID=UPI003F28B109